MGDRCAAPELAEQGATIRWAIERLESRDDQVRGFGSRLIRSMVGDGSLSEMHTRLVYEVGEKLVGSQQAYPGRLVTNDGPDAGEGS